MKYKNILVTGGAGFVGSNLALKIKAAYPEAEVAALDNLYRKGSELNVGRLEKAGVIFIKGDVRNPKDLDCKDKIDLIIECAAEPSVLAGRGESPRYVIDTNLGGTINCLELARMKNASIIFLSTSRIYPVKELCEMSLEETETRFEISKSESGQGLSERGISEEFPLGSSRTLYGATKLASELLIKEYAAMYGMPAIINRCGVIAGPWQFGKVDQGVISLWVARHLFKDKKLSYIGFGGEGKQVRDFMHVDDLFEAVRIQMEQFEKFQGETFNVGGGREKSVSLKELTLLCQKITGNTIEIEKNPENRAADIPLYISDYRKFQALSGWSPKKGAEETVRDVYDWMMKNSSELKEILG